MKLVLFDCDGTIVDSVAIIHDCMVRTFADFGLPQPDVAQTKTVIGLSLEIALAQMMPGGTQCDPAAMAAVYKDHFIAMRSEPDFTETLFPGMGELVRDLARRDDVLLGMVTGKSRRGVNAIIATQGFDGMFATIRTADDCPSKPHPAMVLECMSETGFDPHQTLVIGDAIYDMQMARSAGTLALGVSWGYHDSDALLDAGAHGILQQPDDLHDWLER